MTNCRARYETSCMRTGPACGHTWSTDQCRRGITGGWRAWTRVICTRRCVCYLACRQPHLNLIVRSALSWERRKAAACAIIIHPITAAVGFWKSHHWSQIGTTSTDSSHASKSRTSCSGRWRSVRTRTGFVNFCRRCPKYFLHDCM